jgi:hypothetical protein
MKPQSVLTLKANIVTDFLKALLGNGSENTPAEKNMQQ